jgi:cytochrome c556
MLAASVISVGVAVPVLAQDLTPAEMIQSRQQRFREIGTAFKTVNDELKKPTPVKVMLTSSAARIAAAAREQQTLFPKGTGPETGIKMKAKADIWARRGEFDAANARLIAEADRLAALTRAGDFDAMRAQVKVVGAACSGCHRAFREDD